MINGVDVDGATWKMALRDADVQDDRWCGWQMYNQFLTINVNFP